MSKFSVYQAIYEVSQHEKTVKKDAKPLEIVRAEISKIIRVSLQMSYQSRRAQRWQNLLSKYIYLEPLPV